MRILIAEDEKQLNTMICHYMESIGWTAIPAENGTQVLELFRSEKPDFILLDIMMPRLDGLEVIRCIRETSQVPVIIITALAEEADKLIGLELGADDYITKPFSLKEMTARIRTVMRRISPKVLESANAILTVGDLVLDPLKRVFSRKGEQLEMTSVQFDVLHGFMKNPGRVFKRTEILEFFQDHAWEGYDRTIDVHIKNIRKILEPDRDNPRYLHTVRGVGYKLTGGV